MTLTRLELENFQAHESFAVDLDPAVTTFIGPSDRGKSSILRALTWLVTNKPSGDAFVRRGSKRCRVRLTLDGRTVERERGPENVYRLDGTELKAVGVNVPDPVAALLNVGPVCFQGQHDAPFLLTETPGNAAKALNEIVALDLIDRALGNAAAAVRKATSEAEVSRDRLKAAKARRNELSWVPELDADLQAAEAAVIAWQESCTKAAQTALLVQAAETLSGDVKAAQAKADAAGEASAAVGRAVAAVREAEDLNNRIAEWEELEGKLCQATDSAARLEKELARKVGERCPICGTRSR